MLYIIADTAKAKAAGFDPLTHRTEGKWVLLNGYLKEKQWIALNEKEAMNAQALGGTLEERAKALGGKIYTLAEAKDELTRLSIEAQRWNREL